MVIPHQRISADTVEVTGIETARSILKLLEQLDDHDDVQSVAANYEMSDEVMAAASK